ncbi:MAG: hypothetical protein WBA67_12105 [Jannaschia sp.]
MSVSPSSFDLVGDGDDLDLLMSVEEIFGIAVTDEEAARLRMFGNLTDLVEARMDARTTHVCLLREMLLALRDGIGQPDLSPSTPLTRLMGRTPPARWLARVSAASDLDLNAPLPVTRIASVAAAAVPILGAVVAIWWWREPGALLLALAVIPAQMHPNLPRRLPDHLRTVADLLRARLHTNYPRLRANFGPGNAADRRRVLEGLCRDISGFERPIAADTTFFRTP